MARRLRRAKRTALGASIEKATAAVLASGRAVDDADGPVQDALADRDGADDDLDMGAQDARARLAGRSGDAARRPPYTLIFPDGLGYYTAAPLDEEARRYGELKQRVMEHLPAKDEIRVALPGTIDRGLSEFAAASKELEAARTKVALANTRLDAAEEAWANQVEKVYGALVAEIGRSGAEKFFPAVGRTKNVPAEAAPAQA